MLKLEWHNEKRKISDLIPYESNPRNLTEKQYKDLKKSLTKFNLAEIPAINLDNKICAGHQRLKIMSEVYGSDFEIDVRVPNRKLSEKEFQEYNVRSNKNTGEWQFDILANEFEVDELIEWGFDEKELDLNLWNDTDESKLDEVPEVPKVAVSKLGDLFILDGKHRVMCGDSTKAEDVEKLMDGKKADMVFTDPPYGIGYEYNTHKDIKGDEYLEFCEKFFDNIKDNKFIVISTGWKYNEYWINKKPRDMMFWLQRNKQTGGTLFHFRRIEPLFVWGDPDKKYNFDFFEETSDRIDGMREKHTCPKPVKLLTEIISVSKKVVLDVFLGSGTTLIACQQTNRICYGMEIDPLYIDVILKRYKKLYPEAKFECLNRKYDFNKLFTE